MDDVQFQDDGSALVQLAPSDEAVDQPEVPFDGNLLSLLSEEELSKLATKVWNGYEADKQSRSKWQETIMAGLDLLGTDLNEKGEDESWECDVVHPLIIENACKFQAKAIQELWPASGPVKTQIIGSETDEKVAKATRVKKYMNWQVEEQMQEFYDDTEKILFNTALMGTAIRKFYFDGTAARAVGEMIPITNFHVNYAAPDILRANRTTETIQYSEHDFNKLLDSEFYSYEGDLEAKPLEIDELSKKTAQVIGMEYVQAENEGHTVLEQHVYLDLPEDPMQPKWGTAPYVVALHETSKTIISIRRNWKEGDPLCRRLQWYVGRNFVPGFFGPYGYGLLHLLGQITQTASFSLRALIDAGRFANHPGGIKDKRLKIAGKSNGIAPGEWRDAEYNVAELSAGLFPMPYKEPSATLFELTQFILAAGQKFADSQDQVVSDSTNYGPVGTTMALLEASTKFYSSIHKRMHRAAKAEFRILQRLNSENLPSRLTVPINGEMLQIAANDFNGDEIDVIPVSDPNTPSQAQRAALAQAIVGMANQAPQIHDMRETYRKFYRTLGLEEDEINKVVPGAVQPTPKEPLEDILAAMQGQPIKAFPGQDHEAHMEVKNSFIQLPENQQQSMIPFMAAIQANIREHLALQFAELFRASQQQQPGLSPALLANQVLQINLAEARNKANQKLLQDPMFQLEARQVKVQEDKNANTLIVEGAKSGLKSRELDIEEKKVAVDAAKAQADVAVEIETSKNEDARAREANAIKALQVEAQKAAARNKD